MSFTANEVAEWMLNEVKSAGILYQSDAVRHISAHFGEAFIYVNENGNASIDKEVKKVFKKLHKGRVAWDRDAFFWGWT
ncbi:DUF6953 family protein [Paenibacillus elgii]|uniref:Integron gene cassette protein n=1 Tax=Paenibacillus elgii TaxID=189691 RepID=A0A165Q1Z5_9BACL|nr:hypothetical protein [Paenibacillus elgii]KZE73382.1 hypothetical protein AV654_32410 [Paenibacillus elgii]NEN82637.1 hypothetical protein [Paenibacillus elgii]GMX60547.1 hypothetical protein Elgi_06460 [Paenibacillus elgii]